ADRLLLSAFSANPVLVPNTQANIQVGGGATRTLTLVPARGQTGVAPITVTVSDGENDSSTVFPLLVVPSLSVLFCDSFPIRMDLFCRVRPFFGITAQEFLVNARLLTEVFKSPRAKPRTSSPRWWGLLTKRAAMWFCMRPSKQRCQLCRNRPLVISHISVV